jgi:hypothetical protein
VPPKKAKEANWAAVSALAGVAAAVIAFLAYAIPSGTPAPHPQPTPLATSPVFTSSSPAPAQSSGLPTGCQQGEATITRWDQTAGSTWPSRESAAQLAESGIDGAIASGASGTVYSDLSVLSNNFEDLSNIAMSQSSTAYDQVAATISTESQGLVRDCNTG